MGTSYLRWLGPLRLGAAVDLGVSLVEQRPAPLDQEQLAPLFGDGEPPRRALVPRGEAALVAALPLSTRWAVAAEGGLALAAVLLAEGLRYWLQPAVALRVGWRW